MTGRKACGADPSQCTPTQTRDSSQCTHTRQLSASRGSMTTGCCYDALALVVSVVKNKQCTWSWLDLAMMLDRTAKPILSRPCTVSAVAEHSTVAGRPKATGYYIMPQMHEFAVFLLWPRRGFVVASPWLCRCLVVVPLWVVTLPCFRLRCVVA